MNGYDRERGGRFLEAGVQRLEALPQVEAVALDEPVAAVAQQQRLRRVHRRPARRRRTTGRSTIDGAYVDERYFDAHRQLRVARRTRHRAGGPRRGAPSCRSHARRWRSAIGPATRGRGGSRVSPALGRRAVSRRRRRRGLQGRHAGRERRSRTSICRSGRKESFANYVVRTSVAASATGGQRCSASCARSTRTSCSSTGHAARPGRRSALPGARRRVADRRVRRARARSSRRWGSTASSGTR